MAEDLFLMNVVLLAAGLGTRLRPLTLNTPKCLVPIHGKPLLDYWLNLLVPQSEIENIYINLHYKADAFRQHLKHHWSHQNNIKTWFEPELLGTAGTLRDNYHLLQDSDCMVVHADNLSHFDVDAFLATHRRNSHDITMTMMLFHTDQPQQSGIVELDAQQRVLEMHEKQENPPGTLANAAVYILKASLLDTVKQKQMCDISTELIPAQLGHIQGWINDDYHRDIGTMQSYQKALQEYSMSKKLNR